MSFSIMGRFDIFLLGMKYQITSNLKNQERSKLQLTNTIEKMSTDFRDVYDSLIPNIHALNVNNTTNIISDDFKYHPEKYIRNSSDFTNPSFAGDYGPINKPITTEIDRSVVDVLVSSSFLSTLRKNIKYDLIAFFKDNLVGTNPVIALNNAIDKNVDQVIALLDDPNLSDDLKSKQVFNLGFKTRQEISKIFGRKALLAIPSSDIGLSNDYLVFFGKSFAGMKGKINTVVNNAVIRTINNSNNLSKGAFTVNTISTGNLLHFGHSAIRPKNLGEITQGINAIFNSPGFLKTAFNKVNIAGNSVPDLNIKYIEKTGHLKHSLLVDKDINNSMGAIMRIGISFTQDQLNMINLAMAPLELYQGGGKQGKESLKAAVLNRNLSDFMFNKMFPNPGDILLGTSSLNLITLIKNKVLAPLLGKSNNNTAKSQAKKQGDIPIKIKSKITTKKPNKLKLSVKNPSEYVSSSSGSAAIKNVSSLSLTSLQNLINSQLQDVVSANMGDGNARNVLNYRTGRFASSAKVESMSESRTGMITAFYSYMKNPYATFSDGGKQSSPTTRDPKALISKSIREIAQQQVANRLRAVAI